MIHAERAMADSTMYVEDASNLAPVADAATVQVAKLEHQMLTATELYDLLDLALSGVRQLTSGSFVEFWLHDPVDELDRHFDPVGVVSGKVRLLNDSFDLMNLYTEEPSWDRTPGGVYKDVELFENVEAVEQSMLIPVEDQGVLVGSIHVANPRSMVMTDERQLETLQSFVAKVPLLINRLIEMNRIGDFVLLDPVTNVANRAGLIRDLEREINRARRNKRPPLVVVLRLSGLEHMNNLSQRHIQSRVLRGAASQIAAGLRDTDSVGRIGSNSFGIMVVDAPEESVPAIVTRWHQGLNGKMIDDGAGGMVELNVLRGFRLCSVEQLGSGDAVDIAAELLQEADNDAAAGDRAAATEADE